MKHRSAFSGVFVAGVAAAFVPLGCGGAQEDYTVIYRPQDEREANAGSTSGDRKAELDDPAARQQAQTCLVKHGQPWSRRTYDLRYDAEVNEDRAITGVKLRETTLPDDVEGCLREVIAKQTVPKQALRSRSSGPVSGGEKMTRERRGPLGSSDSQNPLVWVWVIVLEAVEVEVVVQVFVGAIAAVGTIATSTKDPYKDCLDKFEACQNTPLGKLQVNLYGESVCATCFNLCKNQGGWPLGFEKTVGWQTCR